MCGDQRQSDEDRLADMGQCRRPQPHAEQQRQHPERAKPAVAHDRQPRLPIVSAEEPVGGVGKTVLMQGAGQRDPGEHRQQRRHPVAASGQLCDGENKRRDPADPGADERKEPRQTGRAWRAAGP